MLAPHPPHPASDSPPRYFILLVVFFGSAAFHATLTYTGQLLDELPMIYGSLMLHHGICSPRMKVLAVGPLIAVGLAITALMVYFRESPLPLQLSYGVLVVTLVVRNALLSFRDKRLRDSNLLSSSLILYLIAFTCWLGTWTRAAPPRPVTTCTPPITPSSACVLVAIRAPHSPLSAACYTCGSVPTACAMIPASSA